jgi:hypothetical protein
MPSTCSTDSGSIRTWRPPSGLTRNGQLLWDAKSLVPTGIRAKVAGYGRDNGE